MLRFRIFQIFRISTLRAGDPYRTRLKLHCAKATFTSTVKIWLNSSRIFDRTFGVFYFCFKGVASVWRLRKDQPIKCSDFAFFKYLGFVLWGRVIHILKIIKILHKIVFRVNWPEVIQKYSWKFSKIIIGCPMLPQRAEIRNLKII